ncbi:PREDICTED: uncharacterized protein LOC105559270, partial [Vollenhovia emeryi]|uniref:uncharacterized protein LOC105559270 n=1 Tax=Vollenhovia emeryi TaxID=411798 RepID=UPI0005F4C4CA
MASESDFASLKKRRTILKSACTRIRTYVDSVDTSSPATRSHIEERKDKLNRHWEEYNNLQSQLEIIDEAEANDRVAFEQAYYDLSARMRDLIRPVTSAIPIATPSSSATDTQASGSSCSFRLPKLDLPKFSGSYDEWFPFHDSFVAIIHANTSLSNIHKLQYLRAAVTGDASAVINSLEILDVNYAVSWELLKERYDNKRTIVQNHIRAIVDLPVMHKENAAELRQITDSATRHVQALRALKRPTDQWDDILVYIVGSKFDTNTAREWQSTLEGSELPTLKQLFDFLSHRCRVLESTDKSASSASKPAHLRSNTNKQRASCNSAFKAKCEYCQGAHFMYQCTQFLALPIPKRIAETAQSDQSKSEGVEKEAVSSTKTASPDAVTAHATSMSK